MTDQEFEQIKLNMEVLAEYAAPRQYSNEAKKEEYYKNLRLFQAERSRRDMEYLKNLDQRDIAHEQKTLVNSYGEATSREITSSSYKRAQNRTNKEVLSFLK